MLQSANESNVNIIVSSPQGLMRKLGRVVVLGFLLTSLTDCAEGFEVWLNENLHQFLHVVQVDVMVLDQERRQRKRLVSSFGGAMILHQEWRHQLLCRLRHTFWPRSRKAMETKLDIFDIKSHLWEILKCLLFSPSSLTTLLDESG